MVRFYYPHSVQAPKGARGAGQVCRRHRITHPSSLLARRASPKTHRVLLLARRASPETHRVLLLARRASPKTHRVLLLARRACPETRRVLLLARHASPKPAEFYYSHSVQAPKPVEFCYSHSVQAPKPTEFCYSHSVQAPKSTEFYYSHSVQSPKPARGVGQVCRRHRITHPSSLLARRAKTKESPPEGIRRGFVSSFPRGEGQSLPVVLRSCLQLVVTEAELAGHNVSEGL